MPTISFSVFFAAGFLKIFDPVWIEQFLKDISPWQYVVLFAVIFAESGLLIGMFLPGDSLLFVAGFLAFKGDLNIWALIPMLFIAAFAGDQVGYTTGRLGGEKFFKNENARILKKSHVDKTKTFFDKHGSKTIVIARFVPIVRTLAPIMAGTAKMEYKKFVVFNVIGALIWTTGITLAGYFLGQSIGAETIDKYLLPIIALVVLLSLSPAIFEFIRHRISKKQLSSTEGN